MHEKTREGFCGEKRDDSMCPLQRLLLGHELEPCGRQLLQATGAPELRPQSPGSGLQAIGASIWQRRGQPVCWTVWRDDKGHTITTPGHDEDRDGDGPLLVLRRRERPVEMVRSKAPTRRACSSSTNRAECMGPFNESAETRSTNAEGV
jgi:hypothetical protein